MSDYVNVIQSPNGQPWATGAPAAFVGTKQPVNVRKQHGALTHQIQGAAVVTGARLVNDGHGLELTMDLPDGLGHALSGPQVTHDDRGIAVYETQGLL